MVKQVPTHLTKFNNCEQLYEELCHLVNLRSLCELLQVIVFQLRPCNLFSRQDAVAFNSLQFNQRAIYAFLLKILLTRRCLPNMPGEVVTTIH